MHLSNWSMPNCTVERDSPKNRNQRVALLLMKLRRYYPFLPEIYSCDRQLQPSIECFQQALDSSFSGEIWANQHSRFFSNKWKISQNFIKIISHIANFTALFLNCVFFKFSSKKILSIAEYLLSLMRLKFYMVKR